jgi:hypothetical protein
MREIEMEDDELSLADEMKYQAWARRKCEAWNWNADVAEIAKELIDEGVDTEGHQFRILCEVFNEFFKEPKMDVTEAIEQIMETFA